MQLTVLITFMFVLCKSLSNDQEKKNQENKTLYKQPRCPSGGRQVNEL